MESLGKTLRALSRLAILSLIVGHAPTVAHAGRLLERLPADSAQAAQWRAAGHMAAAESLLALRTTQAEAEHDSRALAQLLRLRGADLAARSRPLPALLLLERSERLAKGLRDTTAWVRALRWQAYAEGTLGRMARQRTTSERQLELARAIGDSSYEASALHSLGWLARRLGDWPAAQSSLEGALSIYRALGDEANQAFVSATLGSVYLSRGRIALARRTFTRALTLARRQHQPWVEAQTLNDLGALENLAGDAARATDYLRQAYHSYLEQDAQVEALLTLGNLISSEIEQGHRDDAMALSRQGLATADRHGLRAQRIWFLASMAYVEQERGRPHQAAALWRAGLALGDTAWIEDRAWCHTGLAHALATLDSMPAALHELRDAMARLEPRISLQVGLALRWMTARTLLSAGDPLAAHAIASARLAEAESAGVHQTVAPLALVSARALVALGRLDAAQRMFERATLAWEHSRGSTRDFGWREIQEASVISELAAAQAELRLVHPASSSRSEREAAAFASLQRFKTRTLLERLSHPGSIPELPADRAALTLAALQHEVLRPGELLLETSLGPDSSFLFAISRHRMLLLRLPGESEWARRLSLADDVLARTPRDHDARAALAVLASLRRSLRLDEALAVLPDCAAVIVSPDGILHRAPFEAMLAESGIPVSRTPSAAMLAAMRHRPALPAPTAMLVLDGRAPALGAPLRGASREAQWLADRFPDAQWRTVDSTRVAFGRAELAQYQVLHFAGHTRADDQHPWRSGILVRTSSSRQPALELAAEDIATQPMNAELVVLSSCESGAGRVTTGEGLAGLSTAFLAAGARTVVASLWPVEDEVTARLMREFYLRLARGEPAGEALRAARERLRRDPRTAHPFHWAGFVITGEAGSTPRLRTLPFPRDQWPDYLLGVCILLTILSGVLGVRAARRSRSSRTGL